MTVRIWIGNIVYCITIQLIDGQNVNEKPFKKIKFSTLRYVEDRHHVDEDSRNLIINLLYDVVQGFCIKLSRSICLIEARKAQVVCPNKDIEELPIVVEVNG